MSTWTPKQIRILKKQYASCEDLRALATKLDKTYPALKSRAGILNLRRSKDARDWTPEDRQQLANLYPDKQAEEIARIMNRTKRAIYSQAKKMGLEKSEAFKKSPLSGGFQKGSTAGAAYRFKKGQVPKNKGKKLTEYVKDPHTLNRIRSTQFKKGQVSANTLYDGAIVTRVYHKTKKSYRWIRLNGKWHMLHVVRWTETHGPVPDGHIVVFKDGDTLNVAVKNLECISLAENMRRNTIHNLPPELKEVTYLRTRITKKVKKLKRNG